MTWLPGPVLSSNLKEWLFSWKNKRISKTNNEKKRKSLFHWIYQRINEVHGTLSLTFVERKFNGIFSISKEPYLLVLMNTSSGSFMDLLIFHNMIPKFKERKHAKKKVSGGQGSNSLVFSNEESNKEDQISQFYPMQKFWKKRLSVSDNVLWW